MHNLYRLLRISRDMPVHTLANKAGVTDAYISAIEKGTRTPSRKVEIAILEALDITPAQFSYLQQKIAHTEKFELALLTVLQVLCGVDKGAPQEEGVSPSDRDETYRVLYHDKEFSFTDEGLEAAYQYQEHRILLRKAGQHLRTFIFGDAEQMYGEPLDAKSLDALRHANSDAADAIRYFEQQYSTSCEEASSLLDEYVQRYQEDYDPKIPEETQWVSAIHGVLIEHADL